MDQDKAVKGVVASIKEGEWEEPVEGCGYELGETVHCMEKTKKAIRLVIKRKGRKQGELLEKGEPFFYDAVATNCSEKEKNTGEVLAWHDQQSRQRTLTKN